TGPSSTNCSQAKPQLRTDVPQTAAPDRGRASFANGQNLREVGLHQCPSERNGEGVPVRSLRVPSHVPSQPQTAAKVRGSSPIASGFTAETDWLLEEAGFELSVPHRWASSVSMPCESKSGVVLGTGRGAVVSRAFSCSANHYLLQHRTGTPPPRVYQSKA